MNLLGEMSRPARKPLEQAALTGDERWALRLLRSGEGSTDDVNDTGETALDLAAIAGNTDVAVALLESGADPNRGDYEEWTPLHHACWCGRSLGLVAVLLKYGAELDRKAQYGYTPLALAVLAGHPEVVGLLLSKGASTDVVARDGGRTKSLADLVEQGIGNHDGADRTNRLSQFATIRSLLEDAAEIVVCPEDCDEPADIVIRPEDLGR